MDLFLLNLIVKQFIEDTTNITPQHFPFSISADLNFWLSHICRCRTNSVQLSDNEHNSVKIMVYLKENPFRPYIRN
jgi:hypothetical protein